MKKIVPVSISLCLLLLLGSCYSAKKSYERGNYDQAISLAAKKLRKKPDDQKTIDILVNSWEIANKIDKDDLNRQLNSSNPDWEAIYNIYTRLDNRQRIVMQLPKLRPSNPQTNVDFEFEDYSLALNNAKQNAIQKLVVQGDQALALGGRFNARLAYDYYSKAYGYDNSNTEIKVKADNAFLQGLTHIMIQAAPAGQVNIPENFITQALNKKWNNLETKWTRLHTVFQGNFVYHYYVDVMINNVMVSPDRVVETSYVDTKKIEDGWEYAKNPDGSVRTDSLGNKIKIPVYRDITATVRKYTMTKEATINGTIIIYGNESDRKYVNDPIFGTNQFNYSYATATGDTRALSQASLDLVNRKPALFPSNNDIILGASNGFGNAVYDKVNQNKNVFQ